MWVRNRHDNIFLNLKVKVPDKILRRIRKNCSGNDLIPVNTLKMQK